MSKKRFDTVLIANRGEIACRVIRACKKRGLKSVAVYSEADANSLHTRMADVSECIGPPAASESYLRGDLLIEAAKKHKVNAVHPGYGFLSESQRFASLCVKENLTFIGPSPDLIALFGDKVKARQAAFEAGVPVVQGTDEIHESSVAKESAEKIGYPVLVKTQGGGGGMGISIARDPKQLEKAIDLGRSTGSSVFGNPGVYIEKFLEGISHVEVQVFGDEYGNAIHFLERDCSVQRRNQKVIEEGPCVKLSDSTRTKIHQAALQIVKACRYQNAGTVEFIVDKDQNFYFIELNARIQVEHPVTEMITGIDLVDLQLGVALGEKIPFDQKEIKQKGSAIEVRILAEDPGSMLASPGKVTKYKEPNLKGVRIDSGIDQVSEVSPYYDSLVAKVIAHADSRKEAISLMEKALLELRIEGPEINTKLPIEVLRSEGFKSGNYDTAILLDLQKNKLAQMATQTAEEEVAALAAAIFLGDIRSSLKKGRTNHPPYSKWWDSGIRIMVK